MKRWSGLTPFAVFVLTLAILLPPAFLLPAQVRENRYRPMMVFVFVIGGGANQI